VDERFYENDIEILTSPSLDIPVDDMDLVFEPFDDVSVIEIPISEQELYDLLDEAAVLELQPFEELEPFNEAIDTVYDVPIDFDVVFEGLDYYDFDGIDINQKPEQLGNLLDGFQEDNWAEMDLAGQKEQITGLFDYVTDTIGLENPPNIEYYQGEIGEYGGFDSSTNTLSINENMLHEADEAADTVAHELWHAYQHERALNPQSPKDYMYQAGFDNYIRPSDDFDAYQSQLIESEARAFADQFKDELTQLIRRF
jgi:hypothetical protein